ncbi:THUMP domain-containing protein 1 homolog [Halyomorpha halys]|uniref:THUMP domain-containing protein 1 homolog n=1 Tax=Halyomorpha halys TaxID=286706 RepID=UPI0006D4F3A7
MSSKRTKRNNYFKSLNHFSKKRKSDLMPGLKGFVCTCNGNMKACITEGLHLLDEYNSKINPEENKFEGIEDCDDIEKAIMEEVKYERENVKFRAIDTGINNCIFIGTTIDNPVEIVETIAKEIESTKVQRSRNLIRMLPVEITCKAFLDDIKKAACNIFEKHFICDPVSFSIVLTKRSNTNLNRMEVIEELVLLVKDRNLNHKVDLNSPAKSVIVEIIRNICCLSVVNNFHGYMKLNLIALASNKNTDT